MLVGQPVEWVRFMNACTCFSTLSRQLGPGTAFGYAQAPGSVSGHRSRGCIATSVANSGSRSADVRVGEVFPVVAHVEPSIPVEVEMAFDESVFELIAGHPTVSRPPGTHEIE